MGVRFYAAVYPSSDRGVRFDGSPFFRRDRTRVTDARTSPTRSELGRPRLALTSPGLD